MVQIFSSTENQEKETLHLNITDSDFNFEKAKQMAKEKSLEVCETPMMLSWLNNDTGESYPDYECGVSDRPFWIRYAEGRGANLTINFNDGKYIFMILKI